MNDANKVFIKTEKTFPGCVGVFFSYFVEYVSRGSLQSLSIFKVSKEQKVHLVD